MSNGNKSFHHFPSEIRFKGLIHTAIFFRALNIWSLAQDCTHPIFNSQGLLSLGTCCPLSLQPAGQPCYDHTELPSEGQKPETFKEGKAPQKSHYHDQVFSMFLSKETACKTMISLFLFCFKWETSPHSVHLTMSYIGKAMALLGYRVLAASAQLKILIHWVSSS